MQITRKTNQRREVAFKNHNFPLDPKLWLKEGFLLQISADQFLLGQGPFRAGRRPCRGLYHPDFFFEDPAPWLSPRILWKATRRELRGLLKNAQTEKNGGLKQDIGNGSPKSREIFRNRSHSQRDRTNFYPTGRVGFMKFQRLFYQIQNQIQAGRFQKAVPVFCETWEGRPDLSALLQKLFNGTEKRPQSGFLYGVWNEEKGTAGKTPEIFFTLKDKRFYTTALAGTAVCPGPCLFQDQKEMTEHLLTVTSVKEALKGLVLWKNEVCFEKIFPPLKHLCTEMQGELTAPFDFSLFCKRLHPTGALGGFPSQKVFQWLKREPLQNQRRFFGAPFGFFDGKNYAFCLTAVRGLEWNGAQTCLYSGAGIVKKSVLQKEWRELFLKREQVKSFFL